MYLEILPSKGFTKVLLLQGKAHALSLAWSVTLGKSLCLLLPLLLSMKLGMTLELCGWTVREETKHCSFKARANAFQLGPRGKRTGLVVGMDTLL